MYECIKNKKKKQMSFAINNISLRYTIVKWADVCDNGTYRICKQRRLRYVRQRICFSRTSNIELDEGLDRES